MQKSDAWQEKIYHHILFDIFRLWGHPLTRFRFIGVVGAKDLSFVPRGRINFTAGTF